MPGAEAAARVRATKSLSLVTQSLVTPCSLATVMRDLLANVQTAGEHGASGYVEYSAR
jgi:hypothetical protein